MDFTSGRVYFTSYNTRAKHYQNWILRSNLRTEHQLPIIHRRAVQDQEQLHDNARSIASAQNETDIDRIPDILEGLDDLEQDSEEEEFNGKVEFELGMYSPVLLC